MFAIAFVIWTLRELRNSYGEPYNNAYYEIKILHFRKYDFFNTQGSVGLTDKDDMAKSLCSNLCIEEIAGVKGSVTRHSFSKGENLFTL